MKKRLKPAIEFLKYEFLPSEDKHFESLFANVLQKKHLLFVPKKHII